MEQQMRYRLAGVAAVIGLLVGYTGGAMMHFPPFPIQRLLQSPVADAAVVVLALGTVVSLALWARQPGRSERRAFVAAITSVGALGVILNVLAPALGWWGGRIFEAPLLPLALLTGLRAVLLLGLLLLLYRWLTARRRWLAVLVYSLILLALIPATIFGDPIFLRSGALTFGAGYTIWHDLVLGEVLFALPPVFWEVLRRYGDKGQEVRTQDAELRKKNG
jgi:hypothetical protein